MKRTTTRRQREIKSFMTENRRLFPFVGLFLLGAALGVAVFVTARDVFVGMPTLLRIPPVAPGFMGWLQAFGSRCFSTVGLLAVLYLLGLWACGVPFIPVVPLFYGLGVGLTEGFYYHLGQQGVIAVVTVLLPGVLLTAALLVTAAAESLRLSTCLSRQLLPNPTEQAGLWHRFRLYSLRYLLFVAAAVVIGATEALLRLLLGGLLP